MGLVTHTISILIGIKNYIKVEALPRNGFADMMISLLFDLLRTWLQYVYEYKK